jgi:hypothetical protein
VNEFKTTTWTIPDALMRDVFAAAIIAGMWANPSESGSFSQLAEDAYDQADAMMKQREPKP